MSWKNAVCQTPPPTSIRDIKIYTQEVAHSNIAPIDVFYKSTEILLTQLDPNFFINHAPEITSLLYIGLISASENYFRNVLGFVLSICPEARMKSAGQKTLLGSYLWGGPDLHNRNAFDQISFTSSVDVRETFNNYANHTIKQNGLWFKMLKEYDKLCEIRHGIVHSGMILSGKNALKIGLEPTKFATVVNPTYPTLQEAGSICTTMVQAANNELFEALVTRWATSWRRLPSWNPRKEAKLIKSIYLAFRSDKDFMRGSIPSSLGFSELVRQIRVEFGIPVVASRRS